MHSLKFEVTIHFSDPVTSEEGIEEVQANILRGLVDEANRGMGLAPTEVENTDSEAITTLIEVYSPDVNSTFHEVVFDPSKV